MHEVTEHVLYQEKEFGSSLNSMFVGFFFHVVVSIGSAHPYLDEMHFIE